MFRDGKVAKNDYIGLKFGRFLKRIGITGNFKMLKKTSASLLRDNLTYSGLESLFLDHAPRSTSDKHYAQVPTNSLSEALNWLRTEYRLGLAPVVDNASPAEPKSPKPRKITQA